MYNAPCRWCLSINVIVPTLGVVHMYKTIMLGSCVAVQGLFLRALNNGKIAILVGNKEFIGVPVETYHK